jgi:DNA-binding LacI/PurR family transcriptional regulator
MNDTTYIDNSDRVKEVMQKLVADISSGKIDSQKRLPGYRTLCSRYQASDSTLLKAIELLERKRVLQRRPRSGTYVMKEFARTMSTAKILAFVFPEKAISRDTLKYENWAIVTEVFQGVISTADALHVKVEFRYMPATEERLELERQVNELSEASGVIMFGTQLSPLKENLMNAGKKVTTIFSYRELGNPDDNVIGCKLEESILQMAKHLTKLKYKKMALVIGETDLASKSGKLELQSKMNYLIEGSCKNHPCDVEKIIVSENSYENLKTYLSNLSPADEVIFIPLATYSVGFLYTEAFERGLKIGKDFQVMGLASGITFGNYFPPVSYFQIPYWNIGRDAVLNTLSIDYEDNLKLKYIKGLTTIEKE